MEAACRKGTNRVAVTSEVFQFISTHWRPAPPSKSGTSKAELGVDQPKDAADADDVEMIDAGCLNDQSHACDFAAQAAAADAVDASEHQEQENVTWEDDGEGAMEVDRVSEGGVALAEGGEKESRAKEDSMRIDDDDEVIIAAPSGDGTAGVNTGQVQL